MKTLNLDRLESQRHRVQKGGQFYLVKPITARIAGLVDAANKAEEGMPQIVAFADVVAALIPDMPRADVDDLEIHDMLAIVSLAGEQVEEVNAAAGVDPAPKAGSPAATPGELSPAGT